MVVMVGRYVIGKLVVSLYFPFICRVGRSILRLPANLDALALYLMHQCHVSV